MDFQNRKRFTPTSCGDETDEKRIAGWMIAAAVSIAFIAWLVTGWLHYSMLPPPLIQRDARSISAPSAPSATICMFADSTRRHVPTPITTCLGRQWG